MRQRYDHWVCQSTEDGRVYAGVAQTQAEAYELWRTIKRDHGPLWARGFRALRRLFDWMMRPSK